MSLKVIPNIINNYTHMTTLTERRINERLEYQSDYIKSLKSLDELQEKLDSYSGKLINKTFYKAVGWFRPKDDEHYYEGYTYGIHSATYSFERDYYIYLEGKHKLEVDSRDRLHIIERIKEEREKLEKWLTESVESEKKLKKFDEKKFFDDVKVLFDKYNQPEHWTALLDEYEVKYPDKQ